MWWPANWLSPYKVHVAPPSVLLSTPSLACESMLLLASPVPAKTVRWLFGSTATAPMLRVGWLSVRGVHVVPESEVFHTPPPAVPAYTTAEFVGSTASEVTRPDA